MTQKLRIRPHYHRKGDDVYFMISKRPLLKMNSDEAALWNLLPQSPLVSALPENAAIAKEKFLKLGICDLVPAEVKTGRKKVLVIEPHCDDAALSVGGLMWLWRDSHEFTIATVAGRSNFTSYFFTDRIYFDPEQVSAIRDGEGDQYAAMIGGRYIGLRNNEATLRFHDANWDAKWFAENKFAVLACNNHQSSRAEHDAWKKVVKELLKVTPHDEIWMPIGAGQHTDHEITRNICLELLAEGVFGKAVVRLYSDVPYDHKFPQHKAEILRVLKDRGAVLTQECHDIAPVIDKKLQLLSVFGSQFKLDAVRHGVLESARLAGGGSGRHECLWRVDQAPRDWDWQQVEPYPPRSVHDLGAYQAWIAQLRNLRSLRILLLNPAGRFREDILAIRQLVSNVKVDAYVSGSARYEVRTADLAGVTLHEVGDGGAKWLKLAGKLALAGRMPIIFVAGDRLSQAEKLARLWPGSRTLVAGTLDEVMRGLRLANDTAA